MGATVLSETLEVGDKSSDDGPDAGQRLKNRRRGVIYSVLMGVSQAAGAGTFLLALTLAPRSAMGSIVMMTGMYGVVTVLLARIVLKELLTWRRIGAIALAICACACLA